MQVAQLVEGQGDPYQFIRARIHLGDGDAIFECIDDHVLKQRCFAFIDKGDDGGIKIMFDGKHVGRLDRFGLNRKHVSERDGLGQFYRLVPVQRRDIIKQPVMWEIRMRFLPIVLLGLLAACDVPVQETSAPEPTITETPAGAKLSTRQAARNFEVVKSRVEPVAEAYCRQRSSQQNCNFQILVDDNPGQPANAYQTLNENGRPLIVFTLPLIQEARNQDELAFVMAHEAAHHIRGHIARQKQNAAVGAFVLGRLAGAAGVGDIVNTAQRVGATVGARSYSKSFELEADALGTEITAAAGYDPRRGAQFFFRIPDPGNQFLGTHPPNAERLRTVERVASGL